MLSARIFHFQRALIKISNTRIGYGIRNSSSFEQEAQKFLAKHSKRASPQSPYMLGTTYKIQLTSALSLTHRITGVGLGLLIYGFGIAEILSPNKNFAQLLDSYYSILPSIGPDILKIFCGAALAYHTCNGIRHLSWDAGFGYSLPKLYLSGYIVIGLTTLSFVLILINNN